MLQLPLQDIIDAVKAKNELLDIVASNGHGFLASDVVNAIEDEDNIDVAKVIAQALTEFEKLVRQLESAALAVG